MNSHQCPSSARGAALRAPSSCLRSSLRRRTSFAFADKNAGTGKTVTTAGTTLTGSDAGNYTLSVPASGLADIFARAITATVAANDKVYDGTTAATGTVTLNGVIAGDNVGTSGTSFAFDDKNAGTDKTVTISGTTLTGSDAGNYTVSVPASALADILQRALQIVASDASKIEGGADPALTYTVGGSGLVGVDSLTGALARDLGEAVGDYAIGQGSLDAGSNYTMDFTPGTFTIVADAVSNAIDPLPNPLRALPLPSDGASKRSAVLVVKLSDLCPTEDSACSVK